MGWFEGRDGVLSICVRYGGYFKKVRGRGGDRYLLGQQVVIGTDPDYTCWFDILDDIAEVVPWQAKDSLRMSYKIPNSHPSSLGAGCSQLLSDMQAFKAANPGCILEDFIRWYSPPDWREAVVGRDVSSSDAESSSKRGHLSRRMQKEGNLWHELWETAKALPAVQQAPLFDEDLAVENIFANLEEIEPLELFKQLFTSLLSSNFMIAEMALSVDNHLSKLFNDCKEYVIAACREGLPKDNLNDLCRVYETVEMIILHPEDVIELTKQAEEANSAEQKSLFRKFGLSFSGRDQQNSDSTISKEQKKPDEKGAGVFTNLFDGKRSMFSKKNKKSDSSQPAEPSDDSSWTIV